MADWQKARNNSEFIAWEDAPDEIKALLQNDDMSPNFTLRVPFGGHIYNATEYKGKVRVFRSVSKKAAEASEVVVNTESFKPDVNVTVTSEIVPDTTSNAEIIVNTEKVEAYVAVKISEVNAKLAEGYVLFGKDQRSAYCDGLVGMVKYKRVPIRVA